MPRLFARRAATRDQEEQVELPSVPTDPVKKNFEIPVNRKFYNYMY